MNHLFAFRFLNKNSISFFFLRWVKIFVSFIQRCRQATVISWKNKTWKLLIAHHTKFKSALMLIVTRNELYYGIQFLVHALLKFIEILKLFFYLVSSDQTGFNFTTQRRENKNCHFWRILLFFSMARAWRKNKRKNDKHGIKNQSIFIMKSFSQWRTIKRWTIRNFS